jgi:hypothetical protein
MPRIWFGCDPNHDFPVNLPMVALVNNWLTMCLKMYAWFVVSFILIKYFDPMWPEAKSGQTGVVRER